MELGKHKAYKTFSSFQSSNYEHKIFDLIFPITSYSLALTQQSQVLMTEKKGRQDSLSSLALPIINVHEMDESQLYDV